MLRARVAEMHRSPVNNARLFVGGSLSGVFVTILGERLIDPLHCGCVPFEPRTIPTVPPVSAQRPLLGLG